MTIKQPLKIMLIIPANNTTMSSEMLAWLPEGSSCSLVRIPRGPGLLNKDTLPAYKETTIELCAQAADASYDAVAYGCTAAGFILGPDGDTEMSTRISQVTGKRVVTTAKSMVLALQAIQAKSIALLTPYQEDVNTRLKYFLGCAGISVKYFDSFYAPNVTALGQITATEVKLRAQKLWRPDADALFIACSQLPTFEINELLSEEFSKPVLSSIQVTAKYLMQYSTN